MLTRPRRKGKARKGKDREGKWREGKARQEGRNETDLFHPGVLRHRCVYCRPRSLNVWRNRFGGWRMEHFSWSWLVYRWVKRTHIYLLCRQKLTTYCTWSWTACTRNTYWMFHLVRSYCIMTRLKINDRNKTVFLCAAGCARKHSVSVSRREKPCTSFRLLHSFLILG